MTYNSIVLMLLLAAYASGPQATLPSVDIHIKEVMRTLPTDSELRRQSQAGARGTGAHYGWMDMMRAQQIKRVVVWADLVFDSEGHPKKISLNKFEYFANYEGTAAISSSQQLDAIRKSGLESELGSFAIDRARHGMWVDLPRPRPHPFIGGTRMEFLDDEWLPVLSVPGYYTK